LSRVKRYNIGAGSFQQPGWINVDHPSTWYAKAQEDNIDVAWDLLAMTSIPVDNGSADTVYSSHCIEHITNAAALNMFQEAHRILKPGGIARIQTPNVDAFAAKFIHGHRIPWADAKRPRTSKVPLYQASLPQSFLWTFACTATEIHVDGADVRLSDADITAAFRDMPYTKALDYCASFVSIEKQKLYPGGHMNWWNVVKLGDMLRGAGFPHVYLSAFGQSKSEDMQDIRVFDFGHKEVSVYIEARK
jgi:SAM-dependent methyltransferase